MDAARGESVTRANFPKSSPSWSVHTTPWHTQMNTQLAQTHVQFTSLRSEKKYQEGRVTFWIIFVFCTCVINPRAAYLPVHWLCGVWVQSPKPVNHSDESRWAMHSLPNSLLVFPQTYREHKTLCRSDELHILLHYIQTEYHQMKQKTRTTLKYQTKEHKQVDGWKPFKRTHTPFHR